jgi:hypothetical protein
LIGAAAKAIVVAHCRQGVGSPRRDSLPSAVPLWKVIAGRPLIGKTQPGLRGPVSFLLNPMVFRSLHLWSGAASFIMDHCLGIAVRMGSGRSPD